MRIFYLLMWVASTSCATGNVKAGETYRYVNISGDTQYEHYLNTNDRTFGINLEGFFSPPPEPIRVCDITSEYMCFYREDSKLAFGIPRKGVQKGQPWEISGKKFDVVLELSSPTCGPDFIIQSSDADGPAAQFLFNYHSGLKSIFIIDSTEKVELEFVQGEVYRHGPVYVANGKGFGASGSCSGE